MTIIRKLYKYKKDLRLVQQKIYTFFFTNHDSTLNQSFKNISFVSI